VFDARICRVCERGKMLVTQTVWSGTVGLVAGHSNFGRDPYPLKNPLWYFGSIWYVHYLVLAPRVAICRADFPVTAHYLSCAHFGLGHSFPNGKISEGFGIQSKHSCSFGSSRCDSSVAVCYSQTPPRTAYRV
jgi:hypothetical protein